MAAPISFPKPGTGFSKRQTVTLGSPIDIENHEFQIPKKEISNAMDIPKWEHCEAYHDLMGFIIAMNDSIRGKKISDSYFVSEVVDKIISLLNEMDSWINDIPPIDQPQRFGNKAFRDWFQKLQENSEAIVKNALDEKFHKAVPEISVYLVESVGNSTRIDYGTGHELAFAAFLCCLFKIGVLTKEDAAASILKIFQRYIELMRRLQQTYNMEPAGSHGVWSLDDYQFLPFLWGSSQFLDQMVIPPTQFTNENFIEQNYKDYILLSCIKYILSVKTGMFAEHSNQLWSISTGVALWSKVNQGFIKMYKAEVLAKFPVVQHFLFGSLLSIKPAIKL